jgi:hypothetical protein
VFHSKLHRLAVVSAALVLAASCSDAPTATPTRLDRLPIMASQQDKVARVKLLKRTYTISEDIATSAAIGPAGGVLAVPEAGLLVYFPPGALVQSTLITATAFKGKNVAYDFQPHGLRFVTPIYVMQELVRTELNTARAMKKEMGIWAGYLANGTDDILPDGSATFSEVFNAFFDGTGSDRLAVFTTTHFSGYAMASGLRGTPVQLPSEQ